MSDYSFNIVDVFSSQALAGNPLAVFPRADGLSDSTMQSIAHEFNFSETTFVLRPRAVKATRRLRCFSPAAEVFGAGHNALGAWWVLMAGDLASQEQDVVWQELGDKVLPVTVTRTGPTLRRVAMTQLPPTLRPIEGDRPRLAAALGVRADALHPALKSCVSSTGATMHLLVPLRDVDEVSRIRVEAHQLVEFAKPFGCKGCYAFSVDGNDSDTVAHARGFFPGIGISEDPATGSAAGPLGVYLTAQKLAPKDRWFSIEQGLEIGRPSRIEVRVAGDRPEVGGACTIVATGKLTI